MDILVIVAHPDDEVLGCGASIAKWSREGINVHVLILAEGSTSRGSERNRDLNINELSLLAKAAKNSAVILGISSLNLHDFPDNRMDSVDRLDVIKIIEKHILQIKPSIVVTHHHSDVNIDHRIVCDSVITACRPQPNFPVKRLLSFETNSSTEWQIAGDNRSFHPNWYEDVTDTLKFKIEALKQYESELRDWPHARSENAVEYLARWRGASIGLEAAEAFTLMREIR